MLYNTTNTNIFDALQQKTVFFMSCFCLLIRPCYSVLRLSKVLRCEISANVEGHTACAGGNATLAVKHCLREVVNFPDPTVELLKPKACPFYESFCHAPPLGRINVKDRSRFVRC